MSAVVTLVAAGAAAPLTDNLIRDARDAMAAEGAATGEPDWLAPGTACDIPASGPDSALLQETVLTALRGAPIDVVAQPAAGRRKRLLVADMDSTIVDGETLDELAAMAGVGREVSAITAEAMNGRIDFSEALHRRVALLGGRPATLLAEVAADIAFNPGAVTLVRTMREHGAHCLLVSGGFDVFVDLVAGWCGFHAAESNRLEIEHGRLTGRTLGPIVTRERKHAAMHEAAARIGVPIADALAIGDGANDLPMLTAAGLGLAYHAKPSVRTAARACLDHSDLTGALFVQGYRQHDFVDAGPPER